MKNILNYLFACLFVAVQVRSNEQLITGFELDAFSDPNAANIQVSNYYLDLILYKNFTALKLSTLIERRKKMQEEFKKYLSDQIGFDSDGELISGQRICLPLITRADYHPIPSYFNYNTFIFRTVKEILDGRFMADLAKKNTKSYPPKPLYHRVVNYNSEKMDYVDLGPDFYLSNKSFTMTAVIRLKSNNSNPNRGGRILSMRDSINDGWELVAPSYYGKQISFYTNPEPGHVDYGKAYIPNDLWTIIGIIFDRDTYQNDVAKVTTFIDGVKDGDSTLITLKGDLSSKANLTVGDIRDENGNVPKGRIDFFEPKAERKRYKNKFFGDIKQFSIWSQVLTRSQMRKHANPILRKLRTNRRGCPNRFDSLDCSCYKVFNEIASYNDAREVCRTLGGTLATPKDDRSQTFLEVLMQRSKMRYFWIGLNDVKEENKVVWADGSTFNYRRDYHRFPVGRPDKTYKTEDCFEEEKARRQFVWNDENCEKLNAFICQVQSSFC